LRDTFGKVGDGLLNPVSYLDTEEMLGVRGFEAVNETSLKGKDYESLKGSALDPYISIRETYIQMREKKVRE
jgi:phospholipid-binding lipoprotein MlaA